MSSVLKKLQARAAAKRKGRTTNEAETKSKSKPKISESPLDLMSLLDDNEDEDLGDGAPQEYQSSLDLKDLNTRISKTNYLRDLDLSDGEAVTSQINGAIQLGISQAAKVIHASVQADMSAFYDSKAAERDTASRTLLDKDSDTAEDSDLFGALTKVTKKQLRKKFPDASTSEINAAAKEIVDAQKDSLDLKDEDNLEEDIEEPNQDYLSLLGVEFLPPESSEAGEGEESESHED